MYNADDSRYEKMTYNRCGKSGLKLPKVSLGFWHNFGSKDIFDNMVAMCRTAFDNGITHFDLANNYGPPIGSAEETFGRILEKDLRIYRDELVISTKAGYRMWEGPYGEWGSKKYLISSLDQSLKRMKLDYVDIFYSHRPDPNTPFEETADALAQAVNSGKALYVGISNYNPEQTTKMYELLKERGVTLLIHQPRYSMLDRWVEDGLLDVIREKKIGTIAFSPLAQGLLTDRYFNGIPKDSRAGGASIFLNEKNITPEMLDKTKKLNEVAQRRGQSLAQMAIAWILKDEAMTSVIIGASSLKQIRDNVAALDNIEFSKEELIEIDHILKK